MSTVQLIQRSTREWVILGICLATMLGLTPFLIHRVLTSDWPIATLDAVAVSSLTLMFAYVYKTRKVEKASLILAFILVSGQITSVALKGPEQVLWSFPCAIAMYYLARIQWAMIAACITGLSIFIMIHDQVSGTKLASFAISFLASNVFTALFVSRNQMQQQQLEELSYKDPLTACYNRRSFEQAVQEDNANQSIRSVILLELDDIEKINAQFGHLAGDEALINFCELARTQLYQGEKLYRISRSKFVIMPVPCDLEGCSQLSKRLQQLIQHSQLHQENPLDITIGIAEQQDGESLRACVRRADENKYNTK
ncbi:GGDEF domain-containing protein [Agaribacterium sp. ZY112]|uniref:GGDEF domain-containing protein n=1 Tax=Agaribacterium sp. ZY112 TaxID=3233574 RepID=UPI0035264917